MIGGMTAMLSVFIGVNYYIAWRLCQCVKPCFPRINITICSAGVCIVLILVMLSGFLRFLLPISEKVKHALGWLGAYWMGIFIYLFLFFCAVDLLLWLGGLIKVVPVPVPSAFRQAATLTALVFTACIVCYGTYHARQIRHVTYDISFGKDTLAEEMKLVLISDLHLGAVGSEVRLTEIVNEINRLQPDLVCISGDIFDNDYRAIEDPDAAAGLLQGITSKYGVYACLGNHDAGETAGEMEKFLERSQVRALYDESVVIDGRLVVTGRLDPSPIGGFDKRKRRSLEGVMADVDTELPVVVLDHNPAGVDAYAGIADLILCGHTHKGQIFPGSLFTGMLFPVDYGYYRKNSDSPQVIVTSGVGTWGMPMRVGTDSEIVSIRLH